MNIITPVDNTQSIRYADFLRITTRINLNASDYATVTAGVTYTILKVGTSNFTSIGAFTNTVGEVFVCTTTIALDGGSGILGTDAVYRFSSAPYIITVPEVDSESFTGLGQLVQTGNAVRDIKSTANETTFTLVGIDTAMLGFVLGQNIKGSKIEAWHGFFDTDNQLITTGGTGGLYRFFTGTINSFAIQEEWMEEIRSYVGIITVSASAIQMILKNRIAGRYTNANSWAYFSPGDASMDRVAFVSNINYQFGKTP